MPVWLQVAGAIASAVLSYFGQYDDTKVKDLIKDVAYDVKLALQKLDEISAQIGVLTNKINELPEVFADLNYIQELSNLTTTVRACLARYQTLIKTKSNASLFQNELQDIYHTLAQARAELQVRTDETKIDFAALAALIVPVAYLLELGLLYRLDGGRSLRLKTGEYYVHWFEKLLDPNVPNSVYANLKKNEVDLANTDSLLQGGLLAPALNAPGGQQAVYCLEHRIGSTDRHPLFPNKTYAQVLGETWIRIYGVVVANSTSINGEEIWDVDSLGHSLTTEICAKNAATGRWYSAPPRWQIAEDFYDSRDIQRFRGQNTAQRIADISNHKKWRTFLTTALPAAIETASENNRSRLQLRLATDVVSSIQAVLSAHALAASGQIAMEDSVAA